MNTVGSRGIESGGGAGGQRAERGLQTAGDKCRENYEGRDIMAFTVFISHSIRDFDTVRLLEHCLGQNGIGVYIFERDSQPGALITKKIDEAMDKSDCVIALMTTDGLSSDWVKYEIGCAKGKGKRIIPIIEQGLMPPPFLAGIEYISFVRDDPYSAVNQADYHLFQEKAKKEGKERSNAIFAAVLIFLTIMALPGKTS